jgi:hypothetical protein
LNAPSVDARLGVLGSAGGYSYLTDYGPHSHITENGTWTQRWTLDGLNLDNVAFIKIDVEGYEYPVVMGAAATIKKFKPVVIVESKGMDKKYGFREHAAVQQLKDWGATVADVVRGDYICRFL